LSRDGRDLRNLEAKRQLHLFSRELEKHSVSGPSPGTGSGDNKTNWLGICYLHPVPFYIQVPVKSELHQFPLTQGALFLFTGLGFHLAVNGDLDR